MQIRTVSAACSASWPLSGVPTLINVSCSGWGRSARIGLQISSASGKKRQGIASPSGSGRQRSIPSRISSSVPVGQAARFRILPSCVLKTAEQPSSAQSICRAVPTVCW